MPDVWGNEDKNVHGNPSNLNVHGNRSDRDIHGNHDTGGWSSGSSSQSGGGYGGGGGGGGYGGGGCFPAGTLIKTSSGAIDIACLAPNDEILAYNPRQNALRSRQVLAVRKYEKRRLCSLTFADGHRILVTSVHSFRVKHDWKQTRNLIAGDSVSCIDQAGNVNTHTVAAVVPTNETEDVFNLIVDGDFSFIADGAIVHSFSRFRRLRVFCWSTYSSITRRCAGIVHGVLNSAHLMGADV